MNFLNDIFNTVFNVHPIHTPTTHFPIALTGAALLFLILALWRRSEVLERAAFFNMALAFPSIILTGITGYRDHMVRYAGDAPMAEVKIFLGVTLFVLTGIIVFSRWRQPTLLWTSGTMLLYISGFGASFIIAGTLGFLGGVILYGF